MNRNLLRSLAHLSSRIALVSVLSLGSVGRVGVPGEVFAESRETGRLTLEGYAVTIEHRPSDGRVARKVASICDERLPFLLRELGMTSVQPIHVFLIPDIKSYHERVGLDLPPWGVAFAFAENQMMLVDVKRATNAWNSLENVIPHELSHLLVAQRTGGVRMPLWFLEGLAQWQAREWSVVDGWRLMESVWSNQAPGLDRITSTLPAGESRVSDAYRVAYVAFQYLFDKRMDLLPGFLDEVAQRGDFSKAFETYWREDEYQYYARFGEHLESKYGSVLMLFQTGPLFTAISLLFVLVILGTWVKNRRKLKRMAETERGWGADGGY